MSTSNISYRLPFERERYYGRVIENLGRGAFGQVEKRTGSHGTVSIKRVILDDYSITEMWEDTATIYTEIACLMALRDSPDVVKVLDIIYLDLNTALGVVLPLANGYIQNTMDTSI